MYSYNVDLVSNYKIEELLRLSFDPYLAIRSMKRYEIDNTILLRNEERRDPVFLQFHFTGNEIVLGVQGILKTKQARDLISGRDHRTMNSVFKKRNGLLVHQYFIFCIYSLEIKSYSAEL